MRRWGGLRRSAPAGDRADRLSGLDMTEIALLAAAAAVFALGTLFNFAELTIAAIEPWQIDELLLTLPLLTLALALALRRRALAWQRQDARFRAMVEQAADVVAIVDGDAVVRFVSPALTALLGEQPVVWTGRQIFPLVHPDDVERLRWSFMRLLHAPGATRAFECRLRHQDGSWRVVEVVATNRLGDPAVEGLVVNIRDLTARKAAEAEVLATHQREVDILGRITSGYIVLDTSWNITSVNPSAERMLGATREALLGRNAWEVFAAATETPLYAAAHEAMREDRFRFVEFFYPPLDTSFEARLYPSPEGMAIFLHDVTQRVRLTEELRASEVRYRALVEKMPAVIYTLAADDQATRLYVSPFLEELTGYTPEEALADQESRLSWVHPADRERVAALGEAVHAGAFPFRAEYRLQRKDGGYVWILDECVPVFDASGAVASWQGIVLDITPRVEAEQTRARLAAIVDSADDAIFSIDRDLHVTSWNRGAERLYGYTAEETIGRSMVALVPDGKLEGALAERVASALAGRAGEPYSTVRRRKDGSLVDVTVSLSPIRDHTGSVIGVASITRDMTSWKQAEEQLQAALEAAQSANAAKTQFLAMMSHELRTPLQAILGYAELLLANPASRLTGEEREDLGYIQQGGQRMLTLISQLLDLSRLEAGRFEIIREPVDLAEVLEQVRQDVAPQAIQKGLALRIDLPSSLPPVDGDPERLRQVLLNLAGNAVKFTDEGSVEIRATARDGKAAITVSDTGIGIPPHDLPHIFESFHQADNGLTRRHSGAGLGLAIAQKLVVLMDGQITVESAPGKGSTFTLTMPALC